MTAAFCILAMNVNDGIDVTMHKNLAIAYEYAIEKIHDLFPGESIYCFDDVRELADETGIIVEFRDIDIETLEVLEL